MPTKNLEEGFSFTESLEKSGPFSISFSENFTLVESIQKIGPASVAYSESFELGEIYVDNFEAAPTIYVATVIDLETGYASPGISWTRKFEPWPLDRDAIRISLTDRIDTLKLTFSNIGWHRFLGYLRDEDHHGKRVKIWQGFLDIAQEEANLAELFEGEIDRVNYNEQVIMVSLKGNASYLERDGLSRTYSVYCPFKFKSRQCGYVGPDTICDKSFADCNGRGNGGRFGGFRTLLVVQGTREII